MAFTKEQEKEAVETIFTKLSSGLSDKQIIQDMGLTVEEYVGLKGAMLDAKADEVRSRPHEHVYVEYMIAQMGNVRDLSSMIDQMHVKKKYASLVSAVRARSDILDNLIEKGQEFGLIHKKPERKEIVAGVMVSELSNDKLKKLIIGELGVLNNLRKEFGEKDFAKIEASDSLHHGPALPEKIEAEDGVMTPDEVPHKNKAVTSKVSKGRRVLRKPPPIEND